MNKENHSIFSETTVTFVINLSVKRASYNPFSDELAIIFQWITFSTMCQVVALFGVGSNIVNIICFVKQGFKDPVNVSFMACLLISHYQFQNLINYLGSFLTYLMNTSLLFTEQQTPFSKRRLLAGLHGLAVADLGCLITVMWTDLCLCPAFIAADLPFEPIEFQFLIGSMPHTTFTRISSWITALITLERCLCIIVPIKVRTIVTVKRVAAILVCVFIFLIANTAPVYIANGLGMKFYPDRNRTLIGLIFLPDKEIIDIVSYAINNAIIPFGAFLLITVCTTILVVQLHNKTKWRKKCAATAQADSVSMRNQKVAKMVVVISALFISCFTPVCIGFIAMSLEPEISVVGKHRNALFVFAGFGLLLESVNSAANIFIYYDMSNKYQNALRQLFGFGSKM